MKFKIRFADQIVGLLVVFAIAALMFVIFMLGSKQRWFAKDQLYVTYFSSANGISENMAIHYKGFNVGKVKSFTLTDSDQVEVWFYIFEEYIPRVKRGSLVEVITGLGSQFLFHPGKGNEDLAEESYIPLVDSAQGREFVREGIADIQGATDSISNLIARANILLDPRQENGIFGLIGQINTTLGEVNGALVGTDETAIGRTMYAVEEALTAVSSELLVSVNRILGELADPDSLLSKAVDGNGSVYKSLESSLSSLAGMLSDFQRVTSSQMPQLMSLVSDLRGTLSAAEDVLVALSNNPLLKNGVPEKVHTESSGTSSRDISF